MLSHCYFREHLVLAFELLSISLYDFIKGNNLTNNKKLADAFIDGYGKLIESNFIKKGLNCCIAYN